MGATCTSPEDTGRIEIPNMSVTYYEKRLPRAELNSYKTDFERDFYMVVNLIRDNPTSF